MLELITAARDKLVGKRGVSTDNEVFRLHYRITLPTLAILAVVISSGQYLGNPIECFSYGKDIPVEALNLYCWVQTTFILPKALGKKVGVDVVAPGIDTHQEADEKVYIKYYQWVGLFLAFQAGMFYITRFLWKAMEGGKIEGLRLEFNKPIIEKDEKDQKSSRKLLAHYLYVSHKNYSMYFYKYVACEVLNFLNVVLQIYFVDNFLGGEFTQYGPEVVKFTQMNQEDRVDPMIKVFPRITKCTFNKFGPTGTIQTSDVFCVLPLNILNEKIFVFFWFWYLFLGLFSGLVVLYRILLVLFSPLRKIALTYSNKLIDFDDASFHENTGFWLILKRLAQNTDPVQFQKVLDILKKKLNGTYVDEDIPKEKFAGRYVDEDSPKEKFAGRYVDEDSPKEKFAGRYVDEDSPKEKFAGRYVDEEKIPFTTYSGPGMDLKVVPTSKQSVSEI